MSPFGLFTSDLTDPDVCTPHTTLGAMDYFYCYSDIEAVVYAWTLYVLKDTETSITMCRLQKSPEPKLKRWN